MEDIDTYMINEKVCILRTSNLLPTMLFMQKWWWRLWELTPDNEWDIEYNVLTYYRPKQWKKS